MFGVQGTGHKFVYAFDRSVSMTGAPLAAAKGQLLASLESLDPVHQFQILFFNHRLTAFDLTQGNHRVAFANDKTREAARQFIDGIIADGGTDRYQALRRALAMEPDVVFFLTDADDAMTPSELKQVERLNDRVGATICRHRIRPRPRPRQAELPQAASSSNGGAIRLHRHHPLGKRLAPSLASSPVEALVLCCVMASKGEDASGLPCLSRLLSCELRNLPLP